ncbi:MAG: NAD(P) transhydrogenase subunit alpha [Solirubrobacterales bacterium]|nr:NAD(P) transhydrogenase subunit alpha [Solirubrobacterales bacterium]
MSESLSILLVAAAEGGEPSRLVTNLALLVVSGFVGYAVISKVPNTLHTPLMSGTNAIHGIVVLGGLLLLATGSDLGTGTKVILFVALVFGAINVIGGFVVTDRMLEMFKAKPAPPPSADDAAEGESA